MGAVGVMVGGLRVGLRSTVHDAISEKKSMDSAPPRRHWAVSKLILVILTLVFAGICLVGKSAIDSHLYGVSGTDPKIAEKPNFSWSQVRKISWLPRWMLTGTSSSSRRGSSNSIPVSEISNVHDSMYLWIGILQSPKGRFQLLFLGFPLGSRLPILSMAA